MQSHACSTTRTVQTLTQPVLQARVSGRVLKRSLFAWLALACLASLATGESLKVVETDEVITVKQNNKTVVTYNKVSPPAPDGIDSTYERSGCLHPVGTPLGRTVTQMFPVDHPHQHGIFTAWVKTSYEGQPVDFWNLAGDTGRVLHERVVSKFREGDNIGFDVDLIHRATKAQIDVLRERWRITVYPTDGSYHQFDLKATQKAITDKPLTISEYHYGGFALRGPTRWLTGGGDASEPREPSEFLNDLGSERKKGNHQRAKWVALGGSIDGNPVNIAVLCHADNFRAPQAARLHPTKPYFCFSPCVDGTFTIDRDHPFEARYRFLVTDTEPDAAWIDQQWQAWCGE
jgi:hypothetical protein